MNIVEQIQENIKQEIKAAVIKAGLAEETQIPDVILETPKEKEHGDYSTNMAMQLARVGENVLRLIAEQIQANIDTSKVSIENIEIAGPSFINFYLDNSYLTAIIPTIFEQGDEYGRSNSGKGEKV